MNNTDQLQGMGSLAIHAGKASGAEQAHITPVYASSTFVFDSAEQGMNRFSGKEEGYIYSRFGNPTSAVAEAVIEALEGFQIKVEDGKPLKLKALLHASGQAAMSTLFLSNLKAGDAVLSQYALYGGTFEFLHNILPEYGIKAVFTDLRDLENTERIIRETPSLKMLHIETPANPTMQCTDLDALSKLAKRYGLLVSVDNTFATPYLQQPFKYAVDFVFHSTTKFLNGHGTAIGGVLIGRDLERMNGRVYKYYKLLGGNSNPFDAFLLIQGMKTLEIRMERHCSNAQQVAEFLNNHAVVERVNYNGLPDHPDYGISRKQMRQPGAVLSFEVVGGLEGGIRFINHLKMCVRAVSLGTVDTLLSHPASMSHYGMSKEDRLTSGITDGLIRMSVGLENVEDILADLDQALSAG